MRPWISSVQGDTGASMFPSSPEALCISKEGFVNTRRALINTWVPLDATDHAFQKPEAPPPVSQSPRANQALATCHHSQLAPLSQRCRLSRNPQQGGLGDAGEAPPAPSTRVLLLRLVPGSPRGWPGTSSGRGWVLLPGQAVSPLGPSHEQPRERQLLGVRK